MGHWLLEVARMGLYMAFPVSLFHIFNQPAYFEKYVIEKKREMYPPEDEKLQKGIDEVIRMMKKKEERKALDALDKYQAQQWIQALQAV